MTTLALINQLRIKNLWIQVQQYEIIIHLARAEGAREVEDSAIKAKQKALKTIEEIYKTPTAI